MRTIRHTFYYPSRSDTFRLYHLTDLHIGHAACDERLLQADIARIAADPRAYWGGGGDYIDAIARKSDKRYREGSMAAWLRGKDDIVQHQVQRFLKMVRPIAHKCLYLLTGNHEDALLTYNDRDVYLEMCRGVADAAGCEIRDLALGWEGFVVLKFRRGVAADYGGTRRIVIYTHHGAGGGRKLGGHALRMEETLLTYDADLVLLGHRHMRQVSEKVIVAPSGSGYKFRQRVGVWCGSYLGAYIDASDRQTPAGNYPQFKQLAPTTVGIVPIIIKPDQRRIVPVLTNGIASEVIDMIREAA